MALTIHSLLGTGELVDEPSIRHGLSGNLCRCTGYRGILAAAADLAGVPWAPEHEATHIAEPRP
jgi:aerobic-type carbon monoxide dehydrogenase small subunit (CoxS/CutS family)